MFGLKWQNVFLFKLFLKFLDLFLYFMTFFSFLCLYVHVRRKENVLKFDIRDVCMWNFPLQPSTSSLLKETGVESLRMLGRVTKGIITSCTQRIGTGQRQPRVGMGGPHTSLYGGV